MGIKRRRHDRDQDQWLPLQNKFLVKTIVLTSLGLLIEFSGVRSVIDTSSLLGRCEIPLTLPTKRSPTTRKSQKKFFAQNLLLGVIDGPDHDSRLHFRFQCHLAPAQRRRAGSVHTNEFERKSSSALKKQDCSVHRECFCQDQLFRQTWIQKMKNCRKAKFCPRWDPNHRPIFYVFFYSQKRAAKINFSFLALV